MLLSLKDWCNSNNRISHRVLHFAFYRIIEETLCKISHRLIGRTFEGKCNISNDSVSLGSYK